jgi:hypothetical protein
MIKLFIVILNWNNADDTLACVESVEKAARRNFGLRIVVVDNASDDESLDRLKKLEVDERGIKLIRNSQNLGFAEGNNIGIKYAVGRKADLIIILNNDTRVKDDFLSRSVEFMSKHSDVGVMSPKIYFERGYEYNKKLYKEDDLGKVFWYAGGIIDWRNILGKNRGVDEPDRGQYETVAECDFATGACSVFRKEALEDVGFYDKRFYMYLEDVDISLRLKKAGWKVKYNPQAVIWHKVAGSSRIGGDLNDYFITRNRLLFGLRYASLRAKLALARESLRLAFLGRAWQRKGVLDFYLRRFGKGSWRGKANY